MNFEELQKTWQAQPTGATITINTDVLLREVRRNQRQFQSTLFWRDVREVGVCGVMTIFFSVWGHSWGWWSLYFLAFCCLFVGAFFLVDRLIQHRREPVKNDSLQACIASSLHQVNHQIWLLKNIFWWYLLPILTGLIAVVCSTVLSMKSAGPAAMLVVAAIYLVFYGATYGGVYWLNQFAIRNTLDPRRRELEALLDGLK